MGGRTAQGHDRFTGLAACARDIQYSPSFEYIKGSVQPSPPVDDQPHTLIPDVELGLCIGVGHQVGQPGESGTQIEGRDFDCPEALLLF